MREQYQKEMELLDSQFGRVSYSAESANSSASQRSDSQANSSEVSSIGDLSQIVDGFRHYMRQEFGRCSSAKKRTGKLTSEAKKDQSAEMSLHSVSMHNAS